MKLNLSALQIMVMSLALTSLDAEASISFTYGHIYTANASASIFEHDSSGVRIGSLSVGEEVRGIAFGPDGLLYATAVRGTGFAVLALDSDGNVQKTYPMSSVAMRNLATGKIAVDNHNIYVAGATQVVRFEKNDPQSGTIIYNHNPLFDVDILPNGNLLAATKNDIREITSSGALVRSIRLQGHSFYDIRGIEYDPTSDNLFVTHLGYSGFFYRLMRVDASSGVLEESVNMNAGQDLFLTDSGDLLVGSRGTMAPRVYSQELDVLGTVGTAKHKFITEYSIPEPASLGLIALFTGGIYFVRRFFISWH